MASDSGQIGCLGVETPFLRLAALHEKYKGLKPKTCEVWDGICSFSVQFIGSVEILFCHLSFREALPVKMIVMMVMMKVISADE